MERQIEQEVQNLAEITDDSDKLDFAKQFLREFHEGVRKIRERNNKIHELLTRGI